MGDLSSGQVAPQPQSAAHGQTITRLALVLGDTISFLIFATIGRRSHGEAAGLNAFFEVVKTAAPFLLGWFLAAPWLGAYRLASEGVMAHNVAAPPIPQPLTPFIKRTVLSWVVACPVGLGLRALLLQRGIPISFAIIVFLTNLVLLTVWRSSFGWWTMRRKSATPGG